MAKPSGDFERAADWFAVARFVSDPEGDSSGTEGAEAMRSVVIPERPPAA